MIEVVVTGSECTGKTTLAATLAERYGTVWVPEYARAFVAATVAPPTVADVDPIARGQIADAERLRGRASGLLVQDTDLLSTLVYARHYFGECPEWIPKALEERTADLYLLLGIDLPWEPDGEQRDRGDRRDEMHGLFRDALKEFGARYVEVTGLGTSREAAAAKAIDELLGAPRGR